MSSHKFFRVLSALVCVAGAPGLAAWGPQGHRVIGEAAFGMLDGRARSAVVEILAAGPGGAPRTPAQSLDEACNWPDVIRDQPSGESTAPLHYINIPRGADAYDRQRDCPGGQCVTEGIVHYAGRLGQERLPAAERWQALAFLCHLAGDLHQPLHAGFRDDRGGNYVEVEYQGQDWNLHRFWDGVLIHERLHDEAAYAEQISGGSAPGGPWRVADVAAWTGESHRIAERSAYPEGKVIDEAFADTAWAITRQQLENAALRLALILNAVLGEGEVVPDR